MVISLRRFGEDVMQTMINWVDLLVQQHKLDKNLVNILDVGTGNGVLLVQLAKLGYRRLTGSDYSPQSIALSGMVLNRNHIQDIQLQVHGLLLSHTQGNIAWSGLKHHWSCSRPKCIAYVRISRPALQCQENDCQQSSADAGG